VSGSGVERPEDEHLSPLIFLAPTQAKKGRGNKWQLSSQTHQPETLVDHGSVQVIKKNLDSD